MKSNFKRAKLAAAVLAATSAAALSPTSHAVNLSDNGLGEVGIVPYYTVRNNIDTYLHVVNTSSDYTVAFKIRFREADNSRDARDFNVFLSPNDVWTAVVTMSADGVTPVVQTPDNSCTAPPLFEAAATKPGMRGVLFTTIGYDGGSPDFPPDDGEKTIERAQEGYVEIIEMGTADPDESSLAKAAVHGSEGIPAGCGVINATYALGAGNEEFVKQFSEPLNVLKVSSYMLRIDKGVGTGVPITTLANFFNPNGVDNPSDPAPQDLMEVPSRPIPNLGSADPVADQVVEVLGPISDTGFSTGYDAVSALMSATAVINEFAVGGAANAANDWVVTFPTKNFYVDTAAGADRIDPFAEAFSGRNGGESCVEVEFSYFNREEKFDIPPELCVEHPNLPECNLNFSPVPGGAPPDPDIAFLCQEVQTLSFAEPVLGSANNYGIPLKDGFTSGWMPLTFPNNDPDNPFATNPRKPIEGDYTYYGLPTLGFSIKTLENGVSSTAGVLNYAVVASHAYSRLVVEEPIGPGNGGEPEPEPEPEPNL